MMPSTVVRAEEVEATLDTHVDAVKLIADEAVALDDGAIGPQPQRVRPIGADLADVDPPVRRVSHSGSEEVEATQLELVRELPRCR